MLNSPISSFVDNAIYFCNPASMTEISDALWEISQAIEADKLTINESLFESIDLVLRKNLQNTLILTCHSDKDLNELLDILTAVQSIVRLSQHRKTSYYTHRWDLISDIINDRADELAMDIVKIEQRPQVQKIIKYLHQHQETTISALLSSIGVSKQRMSNLLREMKSCAMIEENRNPNDTRSKLIKLHHEYLKSTPQIYLDNPSFNKQATKVPSPKQPRVGFDPVTDSV